MEKSEKYYSITEVAKMFNVTYLTISRLVHSGKLKAFKISGAYRINGKDIKDYIDSTKVK